MNMVPPLSTMLASYLRVEEREHHLARLFLAGVVR
jgi:hypothetical protein